MSERTYVMEGGVRCPVCESRNIEGVDNQFTATGAKQVLRCERCESVWVETYKLDSFKITERGQTKEEFTAYLKGTLIPDLRDGGRDATADDFATCLRWMED